MNNPSLPKKVMCCPADCTGGGQPDTKHSVAGIQKTNNTHVKQGPNARGNVYANNMLNERFDGTGNHLANSASRRRINGKSIGIHESRDTRKVDVSVCVGTGCYLRGSYDVLDKFVELTRQLNLEDYIDLKGTFCLENCDSGVSIKVNDEIITGVNETNAEQIFKTRIAMKADPPWADE